MKLARRFNFNAGCDVQNQHKSRRGRLNPRSQPRHSFPKLAEMEWSVGILSHRSVLVAASSFNRPVGTKLVWWTGSRR